MIQHLSEAISKGKKLKTRNSRSIDIASSSQSAVVGYISDEFSEGWAPVSDRWGKSMEDLLYSMQYYDAMSYINRNSIGIGGYWYSFQSGYIYIVSVGTSHLDAVVYKLVYYKGKLEEILKYYLPKSPSLSVPNPEMSNGNAVKLDKLANEIEDLISD